MGDSGYKNNNNKIDVKLNVLTSEDGQNKIYNFKVNSFNIKDVVWGRNFYMPSKENKEKFKNKIPVVCGISKNLSKHEIMRINDTRDARLCYKDPFVLYMATEFDRDTYKLCLQQHECAFSRYIYKLNAQKLLTEARQ